MEGCYMKKHRLSPRCLAVIGNGFDLAHGLKTTYLDFADATGLDFFLEFRNLLTEYCGTDIKWYEFENRINELTMQCFLRKMGEDETVAARAETDLQRVNEQFRIFHKRLSGYLLSVTRGNKVHRLPNVWTHLSGHTVGISFNYTNTAERYVRDVFYVHGSLAEEDILLGYDFRDEPCLVGYEEMQWSKDTCRTQLAFRRYLRDDLCIAPETPQYKELVENFKDIETLRLSGRGFEDDDITGWTYEDILRKYLAYEASHVSLFNRVSLHYVQKIVVLGHSVESDRVYLQELLKRCPHLRKVIIFSYVGEPESEWEKKASFFKPYCKKIRKVMYK